jgi:diguanylate cyclase (GGDEF)-like protein
MSHEPSAPPAAAPDRVFARATAALVAAAATLTLVGGLAIDRLDRTQARAAELALVAGQQTALARQLAESLGQVAATPAGPQLRAAHAGLGWAVERLGAAEARRAALAGPADPGVRGLAETLAPLADGAAGAPGPVRARALAQLFATELAPEAERHALRHDAEAMTAAAHARRGRVAVLAGQLAALAAIAAAIAAPARRRIAAWVDAAGEAERENRHRLLHDPLTQLPNATYLAAHLAQVAAGAERATRQTAVLRIDLDRFRILRETLGARVADEILRITARRIRQALRAGDFAAHLGQDDFVVIASDLEDAAAAAGIAHRLQGSLTKPFSLQGGARRVGCSIGVTLLSDDLPEAGRALANAEIALAEAQEAGSGSVRYFRESLRVESERREALVAELIAGLDRGELTPFFQAQIDLATGELAGFEALVRWRHPRHGLLTPMAFLDFAEAADLTERVGEAVLAQTLAALTAWDAAGFAVPRVGVNFAMAQLRDPRLIEKIKWEVERADVDPGRIAIEVLETVLIKSDEDLMVRNLRGLASAGFQIELDDFGTGHASIQNLRRLMVHCVKIDRSFVFGIETSEEQRILTASMIAMARALGIRTLAEGVETAAAAAALAALGCDLAQGYLVSRPMSLADSFGWLREFRPHARFAALPRPQAGDPNSP